MRVGRSLPRLVVDRRLLRRRIRVFRRGAMVEEGYQENTNSRTISKEAYRFLQKVSKHQVHRELGLRYKSIPLASMAFGQHSISAAV